MFRAALNWARKELEWNVPNPFEGRKLKEPPGRARWLTQSEACRLAGLEDVHPHDLRRTFGSWLVQAGVPIQTVSTLLRHSDIRITDRVYAHLSPDSLREAAAVLDRGAVSRSAFTLPKILREDAG